MWEWITAHPAEAAWAAYGALTAASAAYRQAEPKLKEKAAQTSTEVDDKALSVLGKAARVLTFALDVARALSPHLVAKPKKEVSDGRSR